MEWAQMGHADRAFTSDDTLATKPADLTVARWLSDTGPMGGAALAASIQASDSETVVPGSRPRLAAALRTQYNQWLHFHLQAAQRNVRVVKKDDFLRIVMAAKRAGT